MKKPIPYKGDNQYDKSGFKAKARAHQSDYREKGMMVDCTDPYGTKIGEVDGYIGMHNFYDKLGIRELVKQRYPKKDTLYLDILRSEHIPFNLFGPFVQKKADYVPVLNRFLNNAVDEIVTIAIEYAPKPKADYLNDLTSFDAYIEYKHVDGTTGIVGIEVKYTEQDYKPQSKELEAVNDLNSIYYQTTHRCNLYKQESISELKSDSYRQIWRNHMLGESMLLRHPDKYKHFTLFIVYPKGNVHIGEVTEKFKSFLHITTNKYLPITFEELLASYDEVLSSDSEYKQFIYYCKTRYCF